MAGWGALCANLEEPQMHRFTIARPGVATLVAAALACFSTFGRRPDQADHIKLGVANTPFDQNGGGVG